MRPTRIVAPFALAVLAWFSIDARADDDVSAAAKAFTQAQEAMLKGDAAQAADLYELADELAPSAPALRNAARARVTAGHNAMAATHAAELLRRYPSDTDSRAIAEAMLSKLAPQLAQLDVTCDVACTLLVDDKPIFSKAREQFSLFTKPGARTVVAVFGEDRKATQQVTAVINTITTVRLEAPPKPIETPVVVEPPVATPIVAADAGPHKRKGISRGWFIGGTVLTLALGGAATYYGLATLDTRDKIRERVEAGADATDLYNKGRDQQIRTNVLFGVTAAAGITTIILAVMTNWSGDSGEAKDLAIVPAPDGASLVYAARF